MKTLFHRFFENTHHLGRFLFFAEISNKNYENNHEKGVNLKEKYPENRPKGATDHVSKRNSEMKKEIMSIVREFSELNLASLDYPDKNNNYKPSVESMANFKKIQQLFQFMNDNVPGYKGKGSCLGEVRALKN